jgi:hypothetical protein
MFGCLKRINSAHLLALVARFISLSGWGAYAAVTASKNSVSSKSVKNGSLRGKDVKNGALTGSDVVEGSLSEVPSAAHAESATTAGSATEAAHADAATNADTAAKATTASDADALGGVPADGYARTGAEPVRYVGKPGNPDFSSSYWRNYGTTYDPVGFYKDQFGVVHLSGAIDPPNFAGTVFTLPEGYRPPRTFNGQVFGAMADYDKIATVTVAYDGDVEVGQSFDKIVSLNGISFRAAP